MIVCMDRNRVIGTGSGGLPWKLPRDIAHFRGYTAGKFMLLGRKTYEEMTGWFTTQTPIVMTQQEDYQPAEGHVVRSVSDAIKVAADAGADELVVSGGASIYRLALPYADSLVLTVVKAELEGSAFFPSYNTGIEWRELRRESFLPDEENSFGIDFIWLERVRPEAKR